MSLAVLEARPTSGPRISSLPSDGIGHEGSILSTATVGELWPTQTRALLMGEQGAWASGSSPTLSRGTSVEDEHRKSERAEVAGEWDCTIAVCVLVLCITAYEIAKLFAK